MSEVLWTTWLIPEEQILEKAQPGEVAQHTTALNADPQCWYIAACDTSRLMLWGIHRRDVKPIFTAVDLEGTKFYCSCVIKARPCKHALGLFILATRDQRIVVEREIAPPVTKALKLKM